jgi:hypothetical protein
MERRFDQELEDLAHVYSGDTGHVDVAVIDGFED